MIAKGWRFRKRSCSNNKNERDDVAKNVIPFSPGKCVPYRTCFAPNGDFEQGYRQNRNVMREMHDTPTTGLLLLAGEGHEHRSAPAASESMYTIGEVAKQFGLTLRTLRFYDTVGLLKPVRRAPKRLYGPKDIERLALIIRAKNLGFPLTAIAELIVDEGGRQTLRLSNEKRLAQIALLERKLADIEAALEELRGTLA